MVFYVCSPALGCSHLYSIPTFYLHQFANNFRQRLSLYSPSTYAFHSYLDQQLLSSAKRLANSKVVMLGTDQPHSSVHIWLDGIEKPLALLRKASTTIPCMTHFRAPLRSTQPGATPHSYFLRRRPFGSITTRKRKIPMDEEGDGSQLLCGAREGWQDQY
jgi:hypothetical protein